MGLEKESHPDEAVDAYLHKGVKDLWRSTHQEEAYY